MLLVDDDEALCTLVGQALQRSGFVVDLATSGSVGMQQAKSKMYDVVVLDYHMPDMDGHLTAELIGELRRFAGRPGLIAYTAAPESLIMHDPRWVRVFDELVAKASGLPALLETVVECAERVRRERLRSREREAEVVPPVTEAEPMATVLLVDDDKESCSVIAQAMKGSGLKVDIATSGLHAVQLAGANAYDVVVVDYHMPGMDGHMTAGLICNLEQGARPRLVAYTASPENLVMRDPAWVRLFDELVAKSSGLPTLLETVVACAQQSRR